MIQPCSKSQAISLYLLWLFGRSSDIRIPPAHIANDFMMTGFQELSNDLVEAARAHCQLIVVSK
jgi:hypothetical protein